MKWLPLHHRRQLHISSYMFKIIKGQSPSNSINKFKFISGGSRGESNCNLYTPKSTNLRHGIFYIPKSPRNKKDSKLFSRIYKNNLLESIQVDLYYVYSE